MSHVMGQNSLGKQQLELSTHTNQVVHLETVANLCHCVKLTIFLQVVLSLG